MAHYDIFRDQLGVKYSGYGHALWEPNPGRLYSPTEVGDVGFIREGKFHRLFNALLPADHPSHQRFGVPEHHEPLLPGVADHIDSGPLSPNNFCSYEVTVASGEIDIFANEPVDIPDISFSCSRKGGAVLSLPVSAEREDTIARGDFAKWIVRRIDSWLAFTRRLGLGIDKMGDIILVTGRHRTRSWTNVAFFESQANARASFGVRIANDVGTRVTWSVSHERIQGAVLSQGPSGPDLPEDQCIFVRGYRVARTLKIFPRLKGAAGDTPDPSGDDCEPEFEVELLPSFTQYRDPLHVLLDYITETVQRAPGCDFALVHDDDLDRIRRIGDGNSLETLQSDAILSYLRRSEPEIAQVACSTRSKDSSSKKNDILTDTGGSMVGMFCEEHKSWARTVSPAGLPTSFSQDSTGTELPYDTALTRTRPPADSGQISHKPYQATPPLPDQLRPPESYCASATSSGSTGGGGAVIYDPFTFRKHFKNIGRAYREQATNLVEVCRLYVEAFPNTYIEDDRLQNIFRLADAALSAAGKANKGTTSEAAEAFLRVQEEMKRFGSPPARKDSDPSGDHRKRLPDPLATARKEDEQSTRSFLSKTMKSKSPAPKSKGPTVKVNFVILKSPHERLSDQLIVRQEVNNSTTTSEIIRRFSRYPKNYPERFTPKQNPHFYLQLSDNAASYDSRFHKDPLKDFSHGPDPDNSIFVILDKSCRLYIAAAEPHTSRVFGNLWKPYQTVILKDVDGILDSEDIVLRNIGETQDYWYRPCIIDSSQYRGHLDSDSELIKTPVGNGRTLINLALRSQNVDLMIRDRSMPHPPADSGWKPLPSPEPSVRVQEPGEQTTPRQSATCLPQQAYSIPNTSVPSIGGSTLSPSTESFEAAVNTSEVSLPMRAALVKYPQSVDSGIDQTTSRPPTTRRPQPEFSNPNTSVSSIGDSTLFFSSRESFETLVNTSNVSLPMQVPVGKPTYSFDSGFDQTPPRRSVMRLPRLEYTNPGTSVPSLGGGTLFSTSIDSFETLVNTSEVSLPTAVGKRPQPVDDGIGLQLEAPTVDTLSTPPQSAPPSTLPVTIPSPLTPQDREPQSAPPIRKWEAPGNWFKRYQYDYETESWRLRES